MQQPQPLSFATLLVGSAAFFIVVMTQVFVFRSVPQLNDWFQIALVPLIAMCLQYAFGQRFEAYVQGVMSRKSRGFLVLFILNWLLVFIPVCIIVAITA